MQTAQADTLCVRVWGWGDKDEGVGEEGSNCYLLSSCQMKYKLGLEMVPKIDELYSKTIRGCN